MFVDLDFELNVDDLSTFRRPDEGSSTEARVLRIQSNDTLDVKYGFDRYKDPVDRLGWLINMHPVSQF